ncbi:MAG: Na/Pi cotransporter family protein [Lachnospiraceae bacterium]|nr:Na/Pi cotransporter family protein [Lachnospiraceae bacterium]
MTIASIFALLGGIGLFLFGMTIMSSGLRNAFGANLQTILETATKNKFIAILVGCGMTMLIQSSSATDVMVIGFVNSGMMKLTQAIGVIMGANIGTTITAQITAFNLSTYTPLILFGGAVMYLFIKKRFWKHVGSIIMGFGMLFEGISIMKTAILPLSETPAFSSFLQALSNPLLAFLFGVAFTALLQSSSSSTVIFQTFAMQGLLSYNMAVYLIIGAAIGSVTPNLLASLTANRNGKRSAILNLLFNGIRAGIIVALINIFPRILVWIQALSPYDIGRQIANTHTIFAIIAVVIEFFFTKQIIALTYRIIPKKPEETKAEEDRSLVYMTRTETIPTIVVLRQAQLEITRMGRIAADNLQDALTCFFNFDEELAEEVREREVTVSILNGAITDRMVGLRRFDMSKANMRRMSMMTIATTDMGRLSDHANNIVGYAERLDSQRVSLSKAAEAELKEMADITMQAVRLSLEIFATENYDQLEHLEELESRVDDLQKLLIDNHVDRLMRSACDPVSGVVFSDIVTDMERCSDHAINIAYAMKERPNQVIHNAQP